MVKGLGVARALGFIVLIIESRVGVGLGPAGFTGFTVYRLQCWVLGLGFNDSRVQAVWVRGSGI